MSWQGDLIKGGRLWLSTASGSHKNRIQLVILDVIMPDGSSKPIYDKMLAARSDIKAIFISGYTEGILKETGMIREGLHFLTKPFGPAELESKVREACCMKRSWRKPRNPLN